MPKRTAGRASTRSGLTRTAGAAAVAALGTALLAPTASAAVVPVEIDLISINDFHGRISEDLFNGSVGAAAIGTAVKAFEAENPNTLFVSAGDNIGASTFESMSQDDNPTIDALGAAGLSVSAVGNHEFDRGFDDLTGRVVDRWAASTGLPGGDLTLGANVYAKGTTEPALQEYAIREFDGVNVGFIGTVTEQTGTLVSPDGIADIEFGSQVEAVNRVSAQLSDGDDSNGEADVIVVLTHDGSEAEDCAAVASVEGGYGDLIRNASADVDAFFSGHTHMGYACQIAGPDGSERAVLQGNDYGSTFSHVSLSVDPATGDVVDSAAALVNLAERGYEADPEIQAIVDEAVEQAEIVGGRELGMISDDILRGGAVPGDDRGVESTLGNLVADVHLWATSNDSYAGEPAVMAFMNPGGLRADLLYGEDGVVTFKEAADVQPFANTLITMDLTGAQIKDVLEEQWQPGNDRPKLHLGISEGLQYWYDDDAEHGAHVTAIEFGGEPLDMDATYRIVTNSFLASGGDNFTTFADGANRADSGQVDIDATVAFFGAHDVVDPAPLGRAAVAEEPTQTPEPTEEPAPSEEPTPSEEPSESSEPTVSESPSTSADPTVEPTTDAPSSQPADDGELAKTGATTAWLVGAGSLLLVLGIVLMMLRRNPAAKH
ncbi:bifunctional metallophosphatase/5'-nucleotidase [Zhihengliuella halotolerans]|uniref:5'-nucleotidase n=1 Tax=Zhihengliuella halotolerans TaxID=370736 RepID=A0A4Q8AEZ4_9MICC|nr:bifunctional UDP-sugar hydrolase/5'-nucleotidase [Zhihengliuella halotolerans]RZU62818.1 5'-nucleotidase [Zhihengliuella halotolerans]